jgi:NAD(P)-dependent dehydrogenase (short-subunit alcohol dehydrogenase family)
LKQPHHHHTLIIGGSQGLGLVLAEQFYLQDHHVSIVSRTPSFTQTGIKHFAADLCNEEEIQTVLHKIKKEYPVLNNLIFLQRYRGDEDSWSNEIKVSLTATKTIITTLQDCFSEGGSIVMVSSVADHFIGDEQPVEYHVAKAGLNNMARYYAVTLGQKNIRCNSVSPCLFIKDRTRGYHESEQRSQLYKKIVPLGRAAHATEICNVIEFLCSNKATYITGQNIIVDGGLSAQAHLRLSEKLSS